MEIEQVKADDKIYQEMEALIMQIQLVKKLYPSALTELWLYNWIKFEVPYSWNKRELKLSEMKKLFFAKLQVDKINCNIKELC